MSNLGRILKNSSASFVFQIFNMILLFLIRNLSLTYFGVQLLGISSTFTSLIGALSLADLGFQSAIVYRLYAPLKLDDDEKVNEIINVYRFVYCIVGIFILIMGVCLMPFLKYILKGVETGLYVYIIFYLQIINSAVTYFLSYKQTLLYAAQKDYITKYTQIITKLLFGCLEIFVIIRFKNYYMYLFMEILQTVVFNLLVHKICSKQYPYICHKSINKGLFKDMMQDVKNVFAAKMSNYVYGSTDNIVVSVIISSASVGYLTNYTTIIAQLKNLIGAFLNPIIPFIGQKMVNVKERSTDDFYLYTEIRYVFFCIVGIPMLVLIKTFVSFCYGSQYIISDAMLILLVIDMYISIVYAPCYEYNNAVGLFKQERDVMIVAAVLNLGSSIILAFIMGMSGVLTGTVITQMYLWFSRSYIVFSQCFKSNLKEYAKYWKRNVYDGLCFIIIALICVWVYSFVNIDNLVFRFIVGGFLCEFIVLILYCAVQFRTKEFKKICKIIKNILKGTNK